MIVNAKQYWTEVLPKCIKKTNIIPKEFYYMLTDNKELQKHIDKGVIREFIRERLEGLINEIIYTKGISNFKGKFYISSAYNTNEVEDIIKQVYKVKYINDDAVELIKGRFTI